MIHKLKWNDRAEWEALRSKYIGGSDAAAVVGMNPYRGPFALWLEKTGQRAAFEGNIATETGALLEPYVAQLFTRQTGKKVRRDNYTLVNDLYPWACANVDRRIIGENALLECKTTNSYTNIRKFAAGEYPENWYCQMVHYLAVTGCDRIYLAIVCGGREFQLFTLDRNESEIAALMAAERDFWKHVQDGTAPSPMAADEPSVKDYYSDTDADTDIDLTAESSLLSEYHAAKQAEKEAAERVKELQMRICAALGNHEKGYTESFKVRWTPVTRSTFDREAFAKAYPDIDLSEYYKTSTSRQFKCDRIKGAAK